MKPSTTILTLALIITIAISGWAIYYDYSAEGKAANVARVERQRVAYEQQRNDELKTTPGMEDCVFHDLNRIYAIRCPNSSTTTEWSIGKGAIQSTTTVSK